MMMNMVKMMIIMIIAVTQSCIELEPKDFAQKQIQIMPTDDDEDDDDNGDNKDDDNDNGDDDDGDNDDYSCNSVIFQARTSRF